MVLCCREKATALCCFDGAARGMCEGAAAPKGLDRAKVPEFSVRVALPQLDLSEKLLHQSATSGFTSSILIKMHIGHLDQSIALCLSLLLSQASPFSRWRRCQF